MSAARPALAQIKSAVKAKTDAKSRKDMKPRNQVQATLLSQEPKRMKKTAMAQTSPYMPDDGTYSYYYTSEPTYYYYESEPTYYTTSYDYSYDGSYDYSYATDGTDYTYYYTTYDYSYDYFMDDSAYTYCCIFSILIWSLLISDKDTTCVW